MEDNVPQQGANKPQDSKIRPDEERQIRLEALRLANVGQPQDMQKAGDVSKLIEDAKAIESYLLGEST